MSMIRDFYTTLPAVCGVDKEVAALYADHVGRLFDFELAHPDSVFRRVDGETVEARMSPAYAGWWKFADLPKANFGRNLGDFAARSHLFNKHGIGDRDELARDKALLLQYAPNFPEIVALLPIETASTLSNWS